MLKKLRKHIIFHGHVQGVGFRYTARAIADELGLTGWVRNCWDGTVEMEVQGTPLDISTLLHRLQNSSRWIEITNMDIKPLPVDEEERAFYTRSSY